MANKKRLRKRVNIGYQNNKPVYKWASAYTRKELKAECERIRQEFSLPAQGATTQTAQPQAPFFGHYAQEWYELYKRPGLRASTRGMYENLLRAHILPAFGDQPLNLISANDLQRFILRFDNVSKSLVDKLMMLLRQVFTAAVEDELIKKSPVTKLKPPEGIINERLPIDMENASRLMQAASKHPDGLLPLLMLCTGMRRGEALGLRWEDLTSEAIEVKRALVYENNAAAIVGDTKTRAAIRTIPITPILREKLDAQKSREGYIFGGAIPWPYSRYKRVWAKLQREIPSLGGVSAHRLRHTYLMLLRRAGVDPATQQYLMGHADYETTANSYTHINSADIALAQEQLGNLLPNLLLHA